MDMVITKVCRYPVIHDDHEKNYLTGDVIVIRPDGWKWSDVERENPDWLVINAPITAIEAEALTESARPGEAPYRRRLGLNIEGLSSGDRLTRAELMGRIIE